jgi:hypothetical protein
LDVPFALVGRLKLGLKLLDLATTLDVLNVQTRVRLFGILLALFHHGLFLHLFLFRLRCWSVEVGLSFLSHNECLQLLSLSLVMMFQIFEVLLSLADLLNQMRVRLLLRHELGHHLPHVRVPSASLNLAKGDFDLVVMLHLLFHPFRQKRAPDLLEHKLLPLFLFVLVVRLIGRFFSDLLLSLDSCLAFGKGFFLILDGQLQRHDPFLPLRLLMLNVFHQIVQQLFTFKLMLS